MTTRTVTNDTARAEHEVRQAVEHILARNSCPNPKAVAAEVHAAYAGRAWKPAPTAPQPERCLMHPSFEPPCPLCVRIDDEPADG